MTVKQATSPAESDDGFVVPIGTAAILWSEADGWRLLIPSTYKGNDMVPAPVVALAALANRLQDPDFIDELVEEVEDSLRN
jgi:hypothetical protein